MSFSLFLIADVQLTYSVPSVPCSYVTCSMLSVVRVICYIKPCVKLLNAFTKNFKKDVQSNSSIVPRQPNTYGQECLHWNRDLMYLDLLLRSAEFSDERPEGRGGRCCSRLKGPRTYSI